jgi:hypothetical protein
MRLIKAIGCAYRGRSKGDWSVSEHIQQLELNSEMYANSVTSITKDSMLCLVYETD